MGLFIIDSDKCKRDGICVEECPIGILKMKDANSPPAPLPFAEKVCLRCGHCVAVCPHGAFSLEGMMTDDCQPLDRKLLPSFEQFEHLARARRSIRVYKDKPVPNEELARLINVARYAPTGKNTQKVSWLVVNGRDKIRRLAELSIDWMQQLIAAKDPMAAAFGMAGVVRAWEAGKDGVLRDAPALVIAMGPQDYAGAGVDCAIAITTLELAASAAGMGGCWAGFFVIAANHWQPIKDELQLPEGLAPLGALMIGYPKFRYFRLPERNPARITYL